MFKIGISKLRARTDWKSTVNVQPFCDSRIRCRQQRNRVCERRIEQHVGVLDKPLGLMLWITRVLFLDIPIRRTRQKQPQ